MTARTGGRAPNGTGERHGAKGNSSGGAARAGQVRRRPGTAWRQAGPTGGRAPTEPGSGPGLGRRVVTVGGRVSAMRRQTAPVD